MVMLERWGRSRATNRSPFASLDDIGQEMRHRHHLLLAVFMVAGIAWAASTISYSVFRYTGFGVADPERDKAIVASFRKWVVDRWESRRCC